MMEQLLPCLSLLSIYTAGTQQLDGSGDYVQWTVGVLLFAKLHFANLPHFLINIELIDTNMLLVTNNKD